MNNELRKQFFKERVLFMNSEFSEEKCQDLSSELLYLYNKDKKADITIYIDSYGGLVHSFIQVYNIINSFKCKINTIVTGKAMSAGAYLLLSGTKGNRLAYPYSQIMLHELAYATNYKKLHDHKVGIEHNDKLQKILAVITKKNTKIKKVESFLETDKYLTATEALNLGIIDKIIK